ncbi:hypothetical protein NG798_27670, partial [Ancylothrix sp. C2]|uniref:hypothetical protein n=1 Tax=Ancylothrix sp. D3o TaxID=2953691 RepID=UPI0021BB053F
MRKEIDLLEETKSRHPDGIVEGRLVTVIDWGRDFKSAEMVEMLKEYWEHKNVNDLYIINLKGIDILIPSAAKTLVEASSVLGALWERPVVFTNAEPGVKESLETQANRFNPAIKLLWEDEMEKSNPRKLQWKNEEIITTLTDEEAAKFVESKVHSEFAKSLVSKFKNQSLSTGQLFWLHKLAEQAAAISQPVVVGGVFQAVTSMMEKASTKLQKPRIRILAEEQQEIKLYPADSDSKYA